MTHLERDDVEFILSEDFPINNHLRVSVGANPFAVMRYFLSFRFAVTFYVRRSKSNLLREAYNQINEISFERSRLIGL